MHMEHYTDYSAFCRTDSYQQWLTGWTQPADSGVDRWRHSTQHLGGEEFPSSSRPWSTPRQDDLTRSSTRIPFYLLDSLGIGSLPCVDIGCGFNWFKGFYPTIWGVDPRNERHRDELLTPEWYVPNWGRWDRAFSCNAMHFCDQDTIAQNIGKVRGILKPSGRACMAINRVHIQERTQHYSEARLREDLETTPGMTRMVWIDDPADAGMDGNVWIWLRQ